MKKFIQSKSVWQITMVSLLAFFATVGMVMATTTIGTNISTDGTLTLGTLSAARAIDSVLTDNYVPVQVNAKYSLANPGSAYTLMGGYFKVANDTLDQANLQLVGLGSRVTMGKNATDAYGLQSHLTLVASAESSGNMTAISGKTIVGGSNAGGIVSAGLFTIEGTHGSAFAPNTAYGVWADIVDTNITAGYTLNANDSAVGSGLLFSKSGTGSIAKEITFQNGETIDNAVDGVISLTGIASTTSIRLVNLETITNSTNGTITLADNGGATISFTPANGVITPSTGTINIGGGFAVNGYASTTAAGVISPGRYPTGATPTCGAAEAGGFLWNSTKAKTCVCNGSAWIEATSTATATCF